jgi:hypothetical protein
MAIQFVDIAGRREFLIPGMARYPHFSNIILYPALKGLNMRGISTLGHLRGTPSGETLYELFSHKPKSGIHLAVFWVLPGIVTVVIFFSRIRD